MNYRYSLLSVLLSLAFIPSFAQVPNSLDSLRMYLQTHAPTDSNYVRALNRNAYVAVGEALKQLGKPEQALPYFQKALATSQTNGDKTEMAITENKIGNLFDDLKQPNVALNHYQQSLRLAERAGFDLLQADALDNIARMMNELKRHADGLPFALKSLHIAQKQQNLESMAAANSTLSLLYQSQNDYSKAEVYLKTALSLSQKRHDKETSTKLTQRLSTLYAEQKKYKVAYEFQVAKNNLIDSTATVRTNVAIQKLIIQYESEKKEAQIKLLKQASQLQEQIAERATFRTKVWMWGSILLLLLGTSVVAWLLNRSRLRRLEESQRLRKQIAYDLHDEVGSTLSSISLLSGMANSLLDRHLSTQERTETAQRMVQTIYTDAHQILEAIDEIIWTINPSNDSIQRIALRLQEYAKPLMEYKDIRFSFLIDPTLESVPMSMKVRRNLYLVGKEAINNLIKYSQATQAIVRFERQGGQLSVWIEDNGQGFDPQQFSERIGQTSMQHRAKAMAGILHVQSDRGAGTTLQLSVPIV